MGRGPRQGGLGKAEGGGAVRPQSTKLAPRHTTGPGRALPLCARSGVKLRDSDGSRPGGQAAPALPRVTIAGGPGGGVPGNGVREAGAERIPAAAPAQRCRFSSSGPAQPGGGTTEAARRTRKTSRAMPGFRATADREPNLAFRIENIDSEIRPAPDTNGAQT